MAMPRMVTVPHEFGSWSLIARLNVPVLAPDSRFSAATFWGKLPPAYNMPFATTSTLTRPRTADVKPGSTSPVEALIRAMLRLVMPPIVLNSPPT